LINATADRFFPHMTDGQGMQESQYERVVRGSGFDGKVHTNVGIVAKMSGKINGVQGAPGPWIAAERLGSEDTKQSMGMRSHLMTLRRGGGGVSVPLHIKQNGCDVPNSTKRSNPRSTQTINKKIHPPAEENRHDQYNNSPQKLDGPHLLDLVVTK
jgi:hypothetical protein